jgi:hypothetical protein
MSRVQEVSSARLVIHEAPVRVVERDVRVAARREVSITAREERGDMPVLVGYFDRRAERRRRA